jgi:hypothetical protein
MGASQTALLLLRKEPQEKEGNCAATAAAKILSQFIQ